MARLLTVRRIARPACRRMGASTARVNRITRWHIDITLTQAACLGSNNLRRPTSRTGVAPLLGGDVIEVDPIAGPAV